MNQSTVKIGTWPTPEKPVSIEIPKQFLKEFEQDIRVVIRHPYIVGIPVPMVLLDKLRKDPRIYKSLTKQFEIMLVPK